MLKLSKKTEYALMAVKYIALNKNAECSTAKEIADGYNIPLELLAKVLQQLKRFEIIKSFQGNKGGYALSRSPEKITLIDIISAIENDYHLTDCFKESSSEKDCEHFNCCKIKDPLILVQKEIDKVFRQMTVNQIL